MFVYQRVTSKTLSKLRYVGCIRSTITTLTPILSLTNPLVYDILELDALFWSQKSLHIHFTLKYNAISQIPEESALVNPICSKVESQELAMFAR